MFHYLWEKRVFKKFNSLRDKILRLKKKNQLLTDQQLQEKFAGYRQKIQALPPKKRPSALDKYLVPVFALVREVIRRQKNILLFPTQIFGGIALHYANVAQMNTGEGKTFTAYLPICLNALVGRSVFVVTVNEYLAERDWKLAQPILDFLGISSGVNLSRCSEEEKQQLYRDCTVIYTTGSQLGFDYLRNNMVTRLDNKRKQDYYYAILDEVDSLLIDEGMNPLLISKRTYGSEVIQPAEYQLATQLANALEEKKDYKVNQKDYEVYLTKSGIEKAQSFYQLDNLFAFKNHRYNFLLHNALKAKHFYHFGVEYIVNPKNKRLVLIDASTGRLVPDRVYGSGIHQAIESKENLLVSTKSKTIATITYQNFFRLFDKLSGMTGTAKTEAEEFRQVYGMEVIVIPPYRKLIRKDRDDLIFWDEEKKYQAIAKFVEKNHQTKNQPLLIITPSVEASKRLSSLILKTGIPYEVLNAENHEREAEIIAQAGQKGAITISTNMAGRGTDIILSEEARQAGGLFMIGAGRNTSRRIDDQSRGRSGRQGDPGETQFYVSLEEELIKNFEIKEKISGLLSAQQVKELSRRPLSGKIFNYLISEPQETLRNIHYYNRQATLNYDLLINQQRQLFYSYRDRSLKTLTKVAKSKKTIAEAALSEQEYLKDRWVREVLEGIVDNFWSNYLESLNKIKELVKVKVYLPQEPQEAFFWETIDLFRKGFKQLNQKVSNLSSL